MGLSGRHRFSLSPLAGRGLRWGGLSADANAAVGLPSPGLPWRAIALPSNPTSPGKRGEVRDGACDNSRSHRYCATLVS